MSSSSTFHINMKKQADFIRLSKSSASNGKPRYTVDENASNSARVYEAMVKSSVGKLRCQVHIFEQVAHSMIVDKFVSVEEMKNASKSLCRKINGILNDLIDVTDDADIAAINSGVAYQFL